jgi:hypothetical protein
MIYKFIGIPEENEVKLIDEENEIIGYCYKGQLLVDTNSDYKSCEIIELEGNKVKSNDFVGLTFIPAKDTEEFERTREFNFESLNKKPLVYDSKI